jgi:hypothetical protein
MSSCRPSALRCPAEAEKPLLAGNVSRVMNISACFITISRGNCQVIGKGRLSRERLRHSSCALPFPDRHRPARLPEFPAALFPPVRPWTDGHRPFPRRVGGPIRRFRHPIMHIAIVANCFAWATGDTFLHLDQFLGRGRLFGDVGAVMSVVTRENGRSHFAANSTVETKNIGVEFSGDIFGVAMSKVGHRCGTSIRAPAGPRENEIFR